MPIDLDALGRESEPYTARWDSTAAMLYAVGIGAGIDELAFTTETTEGVPQQVVPTFGVVIGSSLDRMPQFGDIDMTKLVHGEQRLTLHRPIPTHGEVEIHQRIVGIYDKGKGKGAVVAHEREAIDTTDGTSLFTAYTSSFIIGEGGWGGDRGPASTGPDAPSRTVDATIRYQTSPDQALIYRLSGDRNRLHTDPEFARRGGFERPILHGLCTYGFTGRALLHELCGSDPARFVRMEGRFSKPVFPGDALTVKMWVDRDEAVFITETQPGETVIDSGRCVFRT
jgi:acyl dehydratase